jgi:hypothetical protein
MSKMLRLLVASGFVGALANFAAAGEGQLAPQTTDQDQLMQQKEERISPQSQSVSNVVTTRADQNIHQQYGRDSVYGFSPDRKPLKPDQTASRQASASGDGEMTHYAD